MLARVILFAVLLALDAYGYLVLRRLPRLASRPRAFALAWWSVPVVAIAYATAAAAAGGLRGGAWILLSAALVIAYLSKLVLAAFLLVDDLRRLVTALVQRLAGTGESAFWPDRSRFLTQLAVVAGGLPAVVLTYGIVRNPYRYRVHEADVPIVGLPAKLEGFRIAQISDIHSGSFFRETPILDGVRALNDLAPDLACFTGDLVNARATEIEPYIDTFSRIEARLGTYSIIGNHDYGDYVAGWTEADKEANWQRLYRNHERLGWDLLLNEHRVLDVGGEPLALIGVENWSTIDRFPRTGDLGRAAAGAEGVFTKVLMSHDPTHWDAQVRESPLGIQLQLSGHTHGFQFGVEIPGYRWSPSQYVYEQWAGLYTRGQRHLYVNRGFGFLGYPGRVGILPEVTLLRLVAA